MINLDDGLYSEQMLPLTKACVFSIGAVVGLGPTSAPFSVVVQVTSFQTSFILVPCTPWQQNAASL